jgi:hypothetical protein
VWQPCSVAPIWKDNDPLGQSRYPTSDAIFPVYFVSPSGPKCVTRNGNAVFVQDCGSVDQTQLWTDGYEVAITAGTIDIYMKTKAGKKQNVIEYSPSVVGDRMFWCAGLGTDTLVSAPLGGKPNLKKNFIFQASGKERLADGADHGYLACDPFAIATPTGFRVFYSRGVEGVGKVDPNNVTRGRVGAWNEIWKVDVKSNGEFIKSSAAPVVTAGCRPGADDSALDLDKPMAQRRHTALYGCGQPSIANFGSVQILTYRVSGPNDESFNEFVRLSNPATKLSFIGRADRGLSEDGASPEIFTIGDRPTGNVRTFYKLVGNGKGLYVLRRFFFDQAAGTISRDYNAESNYGTVAEEFWGFNGITASGDGQTGVQRGNDLNVLTSLTQRIDFWVGDGAEGREYLRYHSMGSAPLA